MAIAKTLREHARFIDQLGGTTAVRDRIAAETGQKITTQAVTRWKTRHGVAWRYRRLIASWAKRSGVAIPKDFLGPEV